MPLINNLIFAIVGGVFVILGIASILWGFHEEEKYYETISVRFDVREFLERWPPNLPPGALKVGGCIAIAVGLGLLGAYLYWWITS